VENRKATQLGDNSCCFFDLYLKYLLFLRNIKKENMKKLYFLLITFNVFLGFGQYSINFDDMNLGPVSSQSPYVSVWPAAGATDCNVTDIQANSGTQSMQVTNNATDDILVLLGNKTTGSWIVSFNMYVTADGSGYWNIQESETPGIQWNGEFYVGAGTNGGAAGVITHAESGSTVTFPSDQWFEVLHEINLATKKITVTVDGSMFLNNVDYVGTGGVAANQLGSINYYSASANNNCFIDDFNFEEVSTISLTSNQTSEFKAYPNPVKDILTLEGNGKITGVSVYNSLGVLVHTASPNEITTKINMSQYKRGIYLVKVSMGNDMKTVRIIK
jgi:hypothetical protein